MFRGRHDHAIDKKGRLSIPAGFRVEIQRRSEKPPVLTTDQGCLVLRPYDVWEEFERHLLSADPLQPEAQSLKRFFLANSEDAPIDSQGRILIPKHLRGHAHLERDVTVAGVGTSIELWNTASFEQAQQYTLQNLDPMRASVAGRAK
jgi:MraZ protein